MKKILLLVVIVCIAFGLTSCYSSKDNEVTSDISTSTMNVNQSNSSIEGDNNKIHIKSDSVTLSDNTYKDRVIRLKLVEGDYYEDWNPGPIMGTIWKGKFYIDVLDTSGNLLATTKLETIHPSEDMIFTSPFQIQFNDYNNDGDVDFTLGQYSSSNGYDYKLYTIPKDNSIQELVIKDYPNIFISNRTGQYSTMLNKVDNTTFTIEYYDNSKGTFEDSFKWDGASFIKISTKEVKKN